MEEKNWTVLSPVEACTNAHAALLAYVSLICVSKMAASPRAPPAQAKAGLFHVPVVFKQIVPALSIPVLDAKGLTLPTVTLPSLDASGALAHSFSFWQPRADGANAVNEAETRVASGDCANKINQATPPTFLPAGDAAAAENREKSQDSWAPLCEVPRSPVGGAPGLHDQLLGIRSLLPELKVPQLSSMDLVSGSWSGAFSQPWAENSPPADACNFAAPTDDPTGAVDSTSRALQKRASLLAEEGQPAWYAGVLGTKKKSDYAPTTRTWQGGHSRAPELNVSVRSSDSVQLPRVPGDKDYDNLDAARCLSLTSFQQVFSAPVSALS